MTYVALDPEVLIVTFVATGTPEERDPRAFDSLSEASTPRPPRIVCCRMEALDLARQPDWKMCTEGFTEGKEGGRGVEGLHNTHYSSRHTYIVILFPVFEF